MSNRTINTFSTPLNWFIHLKSISTFTNVDIYFLYPWTPIAVQNQLVHRRRSVCEAHKKISSQEKVVLLWKVHNLSSKKIHYHNSQQHSFLFCFVFSLEKELFLFWGPSFASFFAAHIKPCEANLLVTITVKVFFFW